VGLKHGVNLNRNIDSLVFCKLHLKSVLHVYIYQLHLNGKHKNTGRQALKLEYIHLVPLPPSLSTRNIMWHTDPLLGTCHNDTVEPAAGQLWMCQLTFNMGHLTCLWVGWIEDEAHLC
jgi:hypothetical protein